jgi:leucyl aminopeptidase
MNITLDSANIVSSTADTLLIFVGRGTPNDKTPNLIVENINQALGGIFADLVSGGDFTAALSEVAVLYPRGIITARRVILVGMGDTADLTPDTIRRATATGLQKARTLKATHVAATIMPHLTPYDATHAITEGALLGLYQYHGQKSSEAPSARPESLTIHVSADDIESAQPGISVGQAFAAGSASARTLVNLPPNYCTPAYMADYAENIAKAHGLKCTILERHQMEALKMGALLAVAQGSDTPPRFIILEHNADKQDVETVVLVGKGVTFDTGGYSLKTADGMVGMKADMGGGAAVIGAMQTIAMLNIPLRVVGLVPAADNMVSGNAYRPQEVITASNGKTIEIISTDAEGRMLLADALVYAKRYDPAAVVDIATLTGAMVVALGSAASGVYATDDKVMQHLFDAGEFTQERVWRMPLYADYNKAIESDTADMKNSAGANVRGGGAGVAAVFLKNFVDYPVWAHVDMAGKMTSDGDNPYMPKGATGYGARLLAEFVRRWAEK